VTPDYALALATGLLGGFGHCLGMCGPVVAAFSLRPGRGPRLPAHLAYHAGRLTTYGFLGALLGFGGSFADAAGRLAGLQGLATLAAGALMLAMGLGVLFLGRLPIERLAGTGPWRRLARPLLETGSAASLFPLGLLLGFLPCGLSSTILVMAAGTASPARGYLLALAFGLGTVPALLLAGATAEGLGARLRGALFRAGGAAVAAGGVLLLLRGIGFRAGM
jgi:sulfite exporter TauE/SafE